MEVTVKTGTVTTLLQGEAVYQQLLAAGVEPETLDKIIQDSAFNDLAAKAINEVAKAYHG